MSDDDKTLPAAAQAALARGRVIEAIKLVREAKGLGLKEAKDIVDAHRGRARKRRVGHADAPERRGHGIWIVVLAAAALVLWWWARRGG